MTTPLRRLATRSSSDVVQEDIPRSRDGSEMNSSASSGEVYLAMNLPPPDDTDRSDTGFGGGLGLQRTTAPEVRYGTALPSEYSAATL